MLTIFGFNIGIELIQLLVVIAVMPSLLIFARWRNYSLMRNIIAGFIAMAAVAWGIERITENSNIITELLAQLFGFSLYIILISTLIAIASLTPWRSVLGRRHS